MATDPNGQSKMQAELHPPTPPTFFIDFIVAASSGLDGYIKLWDLETGKLLRSIDGGPGQEIM